MHHGQRVVHGAFAVGLAAVNVVQTADNAVQAITNALSAGARPQACSAALAAPATPTQPKSCLAGA